MRPSDGDAYKARTGPADVGFNVQRSQQDISIWGRRCAEEDGIRISDKGGDVVRKRSSGVQLAVGHAWLGVRMRHGDSDGHIFGKCLLIYEERVSPAQSPHFRCAYLRA